MPTTTENAVKIPTVVSLDDFKKSLVDMLGKSEQKAILCNLKFKRVFPYCPTCKIKYKNAKKGVHDNCQICGNPIQYECDVICEVVAVDDTYITYISRSVDDGVRRSCLLKNVSYFENQDTCLLVLQC